MGKIIEKKVKIVSQIDSKEERLKNLEDNKTIYSKPNYEFKEYIDDGAKNSYAIFLVDEDIEKKNNRTIFIVVAVIITLLYLVFSSDSKTYANYKDTALKEAKELSTNSLNLIATDFVEVKDFPTDTSIDFYNCLGELVHAKADNLTIGKMLEWCEIDYKQGKLAEHYNTAELLKDFEPYDGSYKPLEKIIKKEVSNYSHKKTTYRFVYYGTPRPYMSVKTTFKATNKFGALVTLTMNAKFDAKTKELFELK